MYPDSWLLAASALDGEEWSGRRSPRMESAGRHAAGAVFPPGRREDDPRVVPTIAMALLVPDPLGLLVLVGLFVMFVNMSERTGPRWLRRRGYPPPLYLETRKAGDVSSG